VTCEKRENAARDVDEAAGQGKSVDRRLIHDGELPRQPRPLGLLCHAEADVADVLLQRRVVVDAHLLADLPVGLLPHRDFLALAHERELTTAGHRVRGAGDASG
jgi:hypothetical protein